MGKKNKPMTVKKLRKLLKTMPPDAVISFETNELPTVSWSVDQIEGRFGFCMLQSVGEPGSLIVGKVLNPTTVEYAPHIPDPESIPSGIRSRARRYSYARPQV